MVFTAPEWVPPLPFDPPDSIPISDFMLDEKWGRHPLALSRPPLTCGISGIEYSILEVRDRVNALARALSKELGWKPSEGTEWDKIDTLTLTWAIHCLAGISSPANAAYSEAELVYQLKASGAKALFTCLPLLSISISAAMKAGIPKERIYLFDLPKDVTGGVATPEGFKTLDYLITQGRNLGPIEKLRWSKGQGARTTAFLCYSSGTSGLPKGVMITHRNVIANTMQISTFESVYRDSKRKPGENYNTPEIVLGLLPQSHIYSLVVICHASVYRGDQVINLPKFDFLQLLTAIQRFRMTSLFLVPPIIIAMANTKAVMDKFDLSSIDAVFTGAAPLGAETAEALQKQHPEWRIRQGYGLTETSTVIASTPFNDVWFGSCGSLLPSFEAKLVAPDGKEITGYDQPGELVVKSPSVTLGYYKNDAASKETFQDGWMLTGDAAVIKVGPQGTEHVFIVDRIKELIKVKGMQVAPAELEAHLLSHPAVADCAVIQVPDSEAGERPKAFIVKSSLLQAEQSEDDLKHDISKYVKDHKSRHKWLDGGIQFLELIPKSPSGKILRRLLRDKDKEARMRSSSKL